MAFHSGEYAARFCVLCADCMVAQSVDFPLPRQLPALTNAFVIIAFASALNVSRSTSSLSLSLLNGRYPALVSQHNGACIYHSAPLTYTLDLGASVIAKLGFGALSDHVSPWILALVMFSLTSVATFTLWGVVGNIVAGVLVFGGVYGMLAGGWFALWGAFVKGITSKPCLR